MMKMDIPHRRKNPLTGEWVLISPQRTKRPWKGQVENSTAGKLPDYDPKCYLCPGNERANGVINPHYTSTFVFTNDFPALIENPEQRTLVEDDIFNVQIVSGTCRVICYSPKHDLTLARMSVEEIKTVVDEWEKQTRELSEKYPWVQLFENRGAMMGSSNPHPHGQLWATSWIPNEPAKEDVNQKEYYKNNQRPLLMDYIFAEKKKKERIVVENDDWIIVVPFWAIWPFESLLVPKRHVLRLFDLNEHEKDSLAKILKQFLFAYDRLFNVSFPYSMGWHGAPNANTNNERGEGNGRMTDPYLHWQLHAHFYPPLLRSASIKKFMVGFEMLAEAQRDILPEIVAKRLSELAKSK